MRQLAEEISFVLPVVAATAVALFAGFFVLVEVEATKQLLNNAEVVYK